MTAAKKLSFENPPQLQLTKKQRYYLALAKKQQQRYEADVKRYGETLATAHPDAIAFFYGLKGE